MRTILILLFTLIAIALDAQVGKYKPFKLLIVSPDTAIIADELRSYTLGIETNYIKRYYKSLKEMESFLNKEYKDKETRKAQEEIREDLKAAKLSESDAKDFKYYETISTYSRDVFQFYFNEYPPYSTFQVIRPSMKAHDLKSTADAFKADYIVTYANLRTQNVDDQMIFKLTTILYSRNENKVLFEKETRGNTNSEGGMWTCNNSLTCLLVTGVDSSTSEVYKTLSARQKH